MHFNRTAQKIEFFQQRRQQLLAALDNILSYYLARRVRNIFLVKVVEYLCIRLAPISADEAQECLLFLTLAAGSHLSVVPNKYGSILRLGEKTRREDIVASLEAKLGGDSSN